MLNNIKFKKGFTLFELLIVIFLASLMAYFVFSTPMGAREEKVEVNSSNFPHYLQKRLYGDGELICVNKCSKCYYVTGIAKRAFDLPLSLHVSAEYILDKNDNAQKIELGRLDDQKVCLRIRHYKNNSISQVILELENGKKFLFIPSYFGEGKEFFTLNDAVSWWLRNTNKGLDSRGSWY